MMDLIDRQAAIDAINEREWLTQDAKEILAEVIEQLPSEDAIEVVRCKYCKHSTEWYRDKRRCFLWYEDGIDVFEDGYCSYGSK